MNVDDLTVNWSEDGVPKVRELAKTILSTSTSWATIAFLFQEADGEGGWRAPKVSLRRYRKRGKTFVVDKHLTLSTKQQALEFARAVDGWFATGGAGDVAGAHDDVEE
jgi:hypothetical protein